MIGPDARELVPGLGKMLRSGESTERLAALSALANIGMAAQAARDDVAALLEDEDAQIRLSAAHCLIEIDPDPGAAIPMVMHALITGGGKRFSSESVRSLKTLGVRAIPALTKALASKDQTERARAALGLAILKEDARDASDELVQSLATSTADPARQAAVIALAYGEATDEKVVEALLSQLNASDRLTRQNAAIALKSIDRKRRAVP